MICSLRTWLIRLPALVCLIFPVAASAGDEAPHFSGDQGYLLQTGLSLVAIPLTDDDRLQHVAAGSAISAFATYKTGSFWKGCAAALAAGILKEAYDDLSGNGRFEARDVGYTIAGCSFTVRF
jgi:hypothetical protein